MSEMSKQLLRFPKHEVSFIFFTDKKIFNVTPPPRTRKTIECTYASITIRRSDVSVSRLLCVYTALHALYSATLWQCRWLSLNLAARSWFLWNLLQKSTVYTVETNCWWSYCHQSEASLMKFTFSRTMHWLVMYVKQWSSFVVKLRNWLFLTRGPAQQPGPQSSWLQHLGSDAGTSLPHAIIGRGRSAAEVDECSSDQWRKVLDASVRA